MNGKVKNMEIFAILFVLMTTSGIAVSAGSVSNALNLSSVNISDVDAPVTINSQNSSSLTQSVSKPDLVITSIYRKDDKIYYKVKNQGTAEAGYSYSYLYIDGNYKAKDYVRPLSPDQTRAESFYNYNWECSGSSDKIKVCADATKRVTESNGSNNCREEEWTCKPDLIITDIYKKDNRVYYRIKNRGAVEAGYSYSYLYIDGNYKARDYVAPLSPNQTRKEFFSYNGECSGSYKVMVCADAPNKVIEISESNNCREEIWACPAKTIYVDDDFSDDPINHKWNTVQEGINDANSGDKIIVYNGTYDEHVLVNKSVTLEGIDYPIINAQFSVTHKHFISGCPILIINDSCVIKGFKFLNSASSLQKRCWGAPVAGITLLSNNNVIENNIVANNCCGIDVSNSSGNILRNNIISNNTDGLHLVKSSNNEIRNNSISNNTLDGLYLTQSSNNSLKDNEMTDNKYNFNVEYKLPHLIQDIDESNKIDGKSIYYLINESDKIIDSASNAGLVYAINSTNITVKGLILKNNRKAIFFYNTNNSTIENVSVSNNEGGIILKYSSNNSLLNSDIIHSDVGGIFLKNSFKNKLEGNNILNNTEGMVFNNSFSNDLKNNNVSNNKVGIILSNSSNNDLINNYIYSNIEGGIGLGGWSNSNNLTNNHIFKGKVGILLNGHSSENLLKNNQIRDCVIVGCRISFIAHDNKLIANHISNSIIGLFLDYTLSNTISDNFIELNRECGVILEDCIQTNTLMENNISNNYNGICLKNTEDNILKGNIISNNYNGTYLDKDSSDNQIYYNNFIDNIKNQAFDDGYKNMWFNIEEGVGNYWSDYDGEDLNNDGIGDIRYEIPGKGNAKDYYPLMTPWTHTKVTGCYHISASLGGNAK